MTATPLTACPPHANLLALTVPDCDFPEAPISARIVTRPVGLLDANCYFIYSESTGEGFIIDPGGDPADIESMVSGSGAKAAGIFITHGHPDHLAAAAETAAALKAPVYASAEVEMVLSDPDKFMLAPGLPSFNKAAVDHILTGGEQLDIGGIAVEVIATPGHSPGSLTYAAAGGLFVGDLLFRGAIGRVDLPGGSFEQLLASVKTLAERFSLDTTVYSGHGDTTTLAWERDNNPYLTALEW